MLRLAFILVLLQLNVNAQRLKYTVSDPIYQFEQPEVLQKKGIKSVRCIYKDSRQFIWIGTENGLFRFDGTHVLYTRHFMGDKTSLPNNDINNITEDREGFLWVGTNGGIAKMNAFDFHCTIYRSADHTLNEDTDDKVFIDDSSGIWAINSKGVSRFSPTENIFKEVWKNVLNNQPPSAFALCIANYNAQEIVIGTFTDLVFINKKDFSFRRLSIEEDHQKQPCTVTDILPDKSGNLWIGTWSKGILYFDTSQRKFTAYKWQYPTNNTNNIVNSMAITRSRDQEILWIASGPELLNVPLLHDNTPDGHQTILYPFDHFEQTNSKNADKVPLMTDETQSIWMGGKTVKHFLTDNSAFQTLLLTLQGEKQNMQLFSIDRKPYYFISSFYSGNGFYILDSGFHIIKKSGDYPQLASRDAQCISNMAIDSNGRIWISTLAGIYLMDKQFRIFDQINNVTKPDTLSKLKTNAVFISHDSVWIACYKKGIDLFNTSGRKLKHFEIHDGSGLQDEILWNFFRDSKGNIWICGNLMLYKWLPAQGVFHCYLLTTEGHGCVPHEITERPDGTLLIASENGLIHFDPATETFRYLKSPLLQEEENILSVCTDQMGDAWFLTESHLVNYSFSRGSFTLYGNQDGLKTNAPFYFIRHFFNGQLYICQGNRLITFKKQDLPSAARAPLMMITQIQVNDSTVSPGAPLNKLDLKYDQNKLLFEFTGITYNKPEQNQYAYQLTGVDKNWVYTNRNISVYTNLSPGDYLFSAKVSNYAGNWSRPTSIAIYIHSPFWKRWWFISLCVLLILSLLYAIYRYRLNQALSLEKLRSKISTDLHDDIGSTLSSISILSDMLSRDNKEEQSVEMAMEIKNNSLSLMEKMDDIVWSINPKNDTLENLMLRIKRFAAVLFEARDIDYSILICDDISSLRLPMEHRQHIYLIMKEAINNPVKYSAADHADIVVGYDNSCLLLKVMDNGKGFDQYRAMNGNGLMSMQNRAALIKADLTIDSKPGHGTTVCMRIKIK